MSVTGSLYFKEQGFSLIEVMLALLLVGILTTGILSVRSAVRELDKSGSQANMMAQIHQAMMVYLKVNRHFPCPDTDGNGEENRKHSKGTEVCRSRQGFLPTKDLSLPKWDAWSSRYLYRVNARTERARYVNNPCQSASAFGQSGGMVMPKKLAYCPSANQYYCKGCDAACAGNCRPASNSDLQALVTHGYFQLFSPPIGVDKAGDGVNSHKNIWLKDSGGQEVANAILYMVVCFGHNGLQTWQACENASLSEQENCNGDEVFRQTQGKNRDYLDYMTVLEAKKALLDAGVFSDE